MAAESVPTPEPVRPDRDARMWAMICHLVGLAWLLVPLIGNVLAPLIVWLIKREDDPFIDEQGKQAFNFQASMSLYFVIATVTIIGILVLPVIIILAFIYPIVAAVRSNQGEHYRYPLTIGFLQ